MSKSYYGVTPSGQLTCGNKPCGVHAALEITLSGDSTTLIDVKTGCSDVLEAVRSREAAFDAMVGQRRVIVPMSLLAASADAQAELLNAVHDARLEKRNDLVLRWLAPVITMVEVGEELEETGEIA